MTTADVRSSAREKYLPALRDHLLYAAIVAAYCLPFMATRDLFYRDESRYGGVLREMIASDSWFVLTLDGDFYSDKPPLFFTLIRLAGEAAGSIAPSVFFAVVALSALFFVAASDAFLRAAGYERRTVRAANLILLAVPWIAIHMQTVRMDLLFGGLILFSIAAYARGLARPAANLLPLAGGLLAGLAVMVKGPFGAAIPILSVAAFALADGKARRLARSDLILSLVPMALPALLWFAALSASFGVHAFDLIFNEQIFKRAVAGRDSSRPFWLYPLWLAATLLPWLALAPILARARYRAVLFSGPAQGDRVAPRPGLRLVLPMLAATALALAAVSQKHIHYLLPLVPGLAVLVAIAYRRLDRDATRLVDWFYVCLAALALIAPPLALWSLGLLPPKEQAVLTGLATPQTLARFAASLSLAAIPLAVAAKLRGEARLLAGIVSVAMLVIAVKATLIPVLDPVYSPRHVVERFDPLMPRGERLLFYGIYEGSFSYHFDRPLSYVQDEAELRDTLATKGTRFVATTARIRQRDPDLFAGFTPLAESRIEGSDLVLLGRAGTD